MTAGPGQTSKVDMKPKRRKGKSQSKERWITRDETFDDFLASKVSQSQQNIIEWSSSDEEGDPSSESKTCMPGMQKLTPVEKKLSDAFPPEIVNSCFKKKLNVVKHSHSKPHVSTSKQVVKSESPSRSTLPVNNPSSSRKSCRYEKKRPQNVCSVNISDKERGNHSVQASVEPPKTPLKVKSQGDCIKGLDISPVIGMPRTQTASETQRNEKSKSESTTGSGALYFRESVSPVFGTSDGGTTIEIPASPVLGLSNSTNYIGESISPTPGPLDREEDSQLVLGSSQEPTSPVLGSSQEPTSPLLGSSQEPTSPVLGSLQMPTSPLIGSSQMPTSPLLGSSQRALIRRAGRLRRRNRSAILPFFGHNTSPLLGTNKNNSVCTTITPSKNLDLSNTNNEHLKVRVKGRCVFQELSQESSGDSEAIKIEETSSQLLALEDPVPKSKEEAAVMPCGDDILSQDDHVVEEIVSQSDTPDAEDQPDVGIDFTDSPIKITQSNSTKVSQEIGEPSISVESVVSPKEETNAGETSKTGFSWVRAIQQRTPEKPASQPEEFVESTKKMKRKGGHSGRLRRLVNSWQSDVQIWLHETSVKLPEVRTPKVETSVKISSPGSAKDLIKKEFHYDKPNRMVFSPGVRNLQHFLIDSPQSSPGVLSKMRRDPSLAKCLNLTILQIGGKLQNNAAVCEVQKESSSVCQERIKQEIDHEDLSKNILAGSLKYLVFFNFTDHNVPPNLHVNDKVEVYSPWNVLDLPTQKMPVLFTSFFKVTKENVKEEKLEDVERDPECKKGKTLKRKASPKCTKGKKKKIILARWSCSCLINSSILPSMCESRLKMAESSVSYSLASDNSHLKPAFRVVKNASQELQQSGTQPAWTVLEAIEICGGVSDKQVTISVRAHRVISRSNSKHEIEEWEVIGQDANGIFCCVKIPNRPLVRYLTQLIEKGEGTTWTLTHVNVVERLTDSQNPGLFCVISSLHHSYQKTLKDNPLLCPLLKDHISSSSQTYCYVFNVNLGATKVLNCNQEVVIPVSLPYYSLRQLSQVTGDIQRGSVCFHILYKIGKFLYVMSQQEESNDEESMREQPSVKKNQQRDNAKIFSREKSLIMKISISSKATLPRWIPSSGTVMINALVRDIAIWHGNVIIDEYSLIQPQKSEFQVSLSVLVKIVKPLSPTSRFHDLTVVSGTIQHVDEDTASTWLSCGNCGSADVEETTTGGNCSACGLSNSAFNTEYYMEVKISCGSVMQHADVIVKLYQATIQKLLRWCQEAGPEGYDATSLNGRHLGPMVCLVEKVKRTLGNRHTYRLLQLPY